MWLAKSNWCSILLLSLLVAVAAIPLEAEDEEVVAPEQGCTFRSDPSQFLNAQREFARFASSVKKFSDVRQAAATPEAQAPISRRNFIDDEIFGKLEQLKVSRPR